VKSNMHMIFLTDQHHDIPTQNERRYRFTTNANNKILRLLL